MVRRLRGQHPVALIAVGVVITLVLSGTAMAVTDTSFTYSTVQTGYLMIGPGDLVPANDAAADNYSLSSGGATSSPGCFRAPVHLPQGSRITSVRTSYLSGVASNPSLWLSRDNPVTGAAAYLIAPQGVFDDSGTRTFVNEAVPANLGLVSNSLYAYTYGVCVGAGEAFYGARITYQYSSAGD